MSTTVMMQLNATTVAGDWASRLTRTTDGSGTGEFGSVISPAGTDGLAVYLNELRGAVESIKRGAHSPDITNSRTEVADIGYGTPALYSGMRFFIGA